ncbi:hypothetical protein HYH02_009928 [Chlamydomonas schloesseri]|uniref:Cyclic nucleotide-binding domain-containing protein n=1 Tax=Chlamydomonas schloesseri TaxID=2026947 RepID=A0A835TNZ7_9CHLO|nr:hypothetical protein HYH02_009928 [Chlamydomonas schloesseri]|eukprot:KAG2441335.1 hypothetical protein HYH02_009928 [Chlamydomonas schloesseri]
MAGHRRSMELGELRTVPEDGSNAPGLGSHPSQRLSGRPSALARVAETLGGLAGMLSGGSGRFSGTEGSGGAAANGGASGHDGNNVLVAMGSSGAPGGGLSGRVRREPSRIGYAGAGGGGGLSRTSIMFKLHQSSKQLVDLGKLQAKWVSATLVKKSEEQDYVNEEDQGFAALLARHVDVPTAAWHELLAALGAEHQDGQFWQTGLGTAPDFHRTMRTSIDEPPGGLGRKHEVDGGEGAEEGRARSLERKPRRSIFLLPTISPYNLGAVLWQLVILVLDLTYTAFWVPMNVAFCTAEYGNLKSGCTVSDLVGGCLYFANVLVSFQIGVVATHGYRKRTVADGRLVAWLYARYGRFWLDFVASVPFIYLVVVLAGHFKLNKGWVNCLSLLRLLRMVRLVSISKVVYMDSLSGRFQDSSIARRMSVTVLYSALLAYQLAVAINLLACVMVLCAYFEGYENSWMASTPWLAESLPTASPVYQWYCAVYWMIVTTTTTGFGDFQPRSAAEQVVANVAMVGGMVMFGVLVASIGNALSRATAEAHQAYGSRRKIMHVKDWADHRSLPPLIAKQVQNFYADKYGRKQEDAIDTAVMAELPSRLRAKVARAMVVPLMADCHILMELPEDLQSLLAENMRPIRLPAGEDLCQQGDVADCFWVLQDGTVQAVRYKEGSVTIDASETPRLLGEGVLLGDVVEECRVRPWTLRTVSPCRLWGLPLADLLPLMRMYPAIGLLAAEYVKFKAVYTYNGDSTDDHWCELAAIIVKYLQEQVPDEDATEMVADLFKTSAEEQTLQPMLEALLELCASRNTTAATAANTTAMLLQQARSGGIGNGNGGSTMGGGGGGGGGDGGPPSAQPPAVSSASAFGSPAAAAALASALQAVATGQGGGRAATQAQVPPFPEKSLSPPVRHTTGNLAGLGGSGPAGGATVSPFATAAGCAPAGAAVHCPGCQRCVCPSCGQGMDAPGLVGVAAAPAAAAVAQPAAPPQHTTGLSNRPNAGPGVRAWAARTGTLRRVSIGQRPDAVWATERRSMDRRHLGAMSIMPMME